MRRRHINNNHNAEIETPLNYREIFDKALWIGAIDEIIMNKKHRDEVNRVCEAYDTLMHGLVDFEILDSYDPKSVKDFVKFTQLMLLTNGILIKLENMDETAILTANFDLIKKVLKDKSIQHNVDTLLINNQTMYMYYVYGCNIQGGTVAVTVATVDETHTKFTPFVSMVQSELLYPEDRYNEVKAPRYIN